MPPVSLPSRGLLGHLAQPWVGLGAQGAADLQPIAAGKALNRRCITPSSDMRAVDGAVPHRPLGRLDVLLPSLHTAFARPKESEKLATALATSQDLPYDALIVHRVPPAGVGQLEEVRREEFGMSYNRLKNSAS